MTDYGQKASTSSDTHPERQHQSERNPEYTDIDTVSHLGWTTTTVTSNQWTQLPTHTYLLDIPFYHAIGSNWVEGSTQQQGQISKTLLDEYGFVRINHLTLTIKDILFTVKQSTAGGIHFKHDPIIQFRRVPNDPLLSSNKILNVDFNSNPTWGDYKNVTDGKIDFHFKIGAGNWCYYPSNNLSCVYKNLESFEKQQGTSMLLGDWFYPNLTRFKMLTEPAGGTTLYTNIRLPYNMTQDITMDVTTSKYKYQPNESFQWWSLAHYGQFATDYLDFWFQYRVRNLPDVKTLTDVTYTLTYQTELHVNWSGYTQSYKYNIPLNLPHLGGRQPRMAMETLEEEQEKPLEKVLGPAVHTTESVKKRKQFHFTL